MASVKAIAAIALTLMIAVPILMGYGFASHEEPVTYWQTDRTDNATDLLLNSSSYYYTSYSDPQNNSKLLLVDGGVRLPDYVSLSSNYSSIPEYQNNTGSVSGGGTSTTSYSLDYSGGTGSIGTSGSSADITAPDYPRMQFVVTSSSGNYFFSFGGTTYTTTTATIYPGSEDGKYTAVVYVNGEREIVSNFSNWSLQTDGTVALTLIYDEYTQLPEFAYTVNLTKGEAQVIKITGSDYTKVIGYTDSSLNIVVNADNTAVVNGTMYSNVTAVYSAPGTLYYSYTTAVAGSYADAAEGWRLKTTTTQWWTNNHFNDTVALMVYFPSDNTVGIGPQLSISSDDPAVSLSYSSGTLTVNGTTLGSYDRALVLITQKKTTVYGLESWPSFNSAATPFATVEVDYADLGEPFFYVKITETNLTTQFRVDSAEIVAGSFPSTKNFTLDLSEKYPAQSLTFTLKSIAAYGDTIAFGGTSFTVTDGKITGTDADGESFTVALRGVVVRYAYDNGSYTVDINGHEITGTASTVYFGGEWSLTSSVSLISQNTSTQQTWVAGEFAFDKQDFAACGLLVAGACLVGLGMTGARSGIKMGILLLVCGGGALIYLTMI